MRTRVAYVSLVASVLVAVLAIRVFDPAPVARLRLNVFDAYQWLASRVYNPDLPVRIIAIDDESLNAIGQWPWSRAVLGDLTRKLAERGASAVAFDMVMAEPDRTSVVELIKRLKDPTLKAIAARIEAPSPDEAFATDISAAPVVLGFIAVSERNSVQPRLAAGFAFAGDDPKQFVPVFHGAVSSLELLQNQSTGSGSLNWVPEHDQIIRRLPLIVGINGALYPSLAAEALRVGQGASSYVVKSSGASGEESFGRKTGITNVRIGRLAVPTDAHGQMWLKFTKSDRRRFISAARVLNNAIASSEIEGRIMLVGTTAAGLFDLRTTPLDVAVPGVEVHAQAIEQMLIGEHLRRPDFGTGAEILFLAVSGLIMAAVVYASGALFSAILGAATVAAAFSTSWAAYRSLGLLFDPVYPIVALTMLYIVTTGYLYLQTEAERNRVRNAFRRYMAPSLVEELAKHPDMLKLGGELREVTLMFTDVRSFTSISERLDAERLTKFLNRLLTPLSNSILSNRGTIDKYMGDAIMAFWNAPLSDSDHERNAVRAALSMLRDVEQLNAALAAEADARGEEHIPVELGIGLNTAVCCVGNLGSELRFDYSVIGDGVNIASRLEGLSKQYGCPVIAGMSTAKAADELAFLEVDLVSVVGKKEAIHVFTLLGDEKVKKSPEFQTLAARHAAMLAAYRGRRFDEAETLLGEARAVAGERLAALYELYAERIAVYRQAPPLIDWDGRAIAEEK
jgi:adenylate cyclase